MFIFKAAVVGAGTVGGEIAHVIASAGVPVVLHDADPARLDAGLARARALWQARADAGRLAATEPEWLAGLVTGTTARDGFGDVDFLIEAEPAGIEASQALFSELCETTPGHAILAANTSVLSIAEIGEATTRSDRVVGFHLLAPVASARVVEVAEGLDTAPETVQAAVTFAQAIRKLPIRCVEAPGLVVDRVLAAAPGPSAAAGAEAPDERATLRAFVECCAVLEEGVTSAREIDLALAAGAGVTPPPLAGADRAGLDAVLTRLERAADEWGEAFAPPAILRRLVAQGRLGPDRGQGFFPYPRPDAGWEQRPVKLETRDQVAIAWLDRLPANSLSPEVIGTLEELWGAVTGSETVRALVFASANPQLFCAGADIKAFQAMDAAAARELAGRAHALLRAMETSSVVTIAAVNAAALGGGCELAMGCDVRIAAESASFGQPEINLGIVPGFGGTQRLPRLVGEARARELNLTGDPIGAEEAYEIGLVNRVVPDHELLDTALAWARKLAGQAPLSVAQIKRVSAAADLTAGIEAEKDAFAETFGSADGREGITAFVQKRAPRWTGA